MELCQSATNGAMEFSVYKIDLDSSEICLWTMEYKVLSIGLQEYHGSVDSMLLAVLVLVVE